jgi:hypothetical protein
MTAKLGLHATQSFDTALGVVQAIILLIFGDSGIAQITQCTGHPERADPDGSAGVGVLIESRFGGVGATFEFRQAVFQGSAVELFVPLLIEGFYGSWIGPCLIIGDSGDCNQYQQ